jgi:tetratricopeptide (TPR) repeat protein
MKLIKIFILLLFSVLFLVACEETNKIIIPDNITVTPGETKAEALTKTGWQEFEKGQFSKAAEAFRAAIAEDCYYSDAFNGMGWACTRLDSIEVARNNFTVAINSSQSTTDIFRDASAGRAFVNLVMEDYEEAIRDVNNALQIQTSYRYNNDYVFRHDTSIDEMDLLLVRAESYFLMGNYPECYSTLLLLDDTLVVEQGNPEELAKAIEELRALI